jgi:hypothetical protein
MMPAPKGHLPYNVNGEGGRPKIYTEEFINKEAIELEKWMQLTENNFIEFFCFERGYHDDKIADFNRDNERFRRVYQIFKMKQRGMIFEGGLKRKYAHPMCALVLSNNHNIHAKTETTVTNTNQDSLSSILDDIDGNTKDLI